MVADRLPAPASYSVRHSARARHARLSVTDAGEVVVVLPRTAADSEAMALVRRHGAWIERQLSRLDARRRELALRRSLAAGRALTVNGVDRIVRATTAAELARLERRLRDEARRILWARVAARAPELQLAVKRITIRDQRTRWGSASRTGTLSFSWRLILCPPHVLDYVVVHELAHLRQPGHGKAFWGLVERYHPDPGAARRWLRENHWLVRHALD